MADVDIHPSGNHDKTDSHPDGTDETIPFTPGGVIGRSAWEPELRTRNIILRNESENGSSQRTRQSVVSCAIRKPEANPRSISCR